MLNSVHVQIGEKIVCNIVNLHNVANVGHKKFNTEI